jgi:hypothetical protein
MLLIDVVALLLGQNDLPAKGIGGCENARLSRDSRSFAWLFRHVIFLARLPGADSQKSGFASGDFGCEAGRGYLLA